jgi:hypothetical protein
VRNAKKLLAILTFAMLGATTAAQQRGEVVLVRPNSSGAVKFSAPWNPGGTTGDTRVVGTVIDIRQVPVTYARVQLRDLKNGKVLATDQTNDVGEYEFALVEPGLYVVEMVMVDDYVLALSNAGSLRRYETLTTVVQLPGRWDFNSRTMFAAVNASAFFGMGSTGTMTSSTLAMAVDSEVSPNNPGEPVSPQ